MIIFNTQAVFENHGFGMNFTGMQSHDATNKLSADFHFKGKKMTDQKRFLRCEASIL